MKTKGKAISAKSPKPPKPIVYEYLDYKAYLAAWIASQPNNGHGERSRIAECLKCQLAYVSQVLSGTANFSPEQAEALNLLLEHQDEAAEFFVLLVEHARAGTPGLKKLVQFRMQKILNQQLILKQRFDDRKILGHNENQAIYYSNWILLSPPCIAKA